MRGTVLRIFFMSILSRWLRVQKAPKREEVQGVGRDALSYEVGKSATDDGCELESVAAKSTGKRDVGVFWVKVHDEVLVGRHRIHAH